MATPDLATMTSSAQIFSSSHTLPQIRAIHKALHSQIDDKAARLRTRVGGSYRELLGTADTIVAMHKDMDAVQTALAEMGGRCGRAVVANKVAGLGRFVEDLQQREENNKAGATATSERTRLGIVARARLLDACALAVEGLLKGGSHSVAPQDGGETEKTSSRGERLVIAAKVLVLSRLLAKSFDHTTGNRSVDALVQIAKRRSSTLKQKLQLGIERVLGHSGEQVQLGDILKTLSAHSLATSSGARDVLWYFLKVRSQAMALTFEDEGHERTRSPKDVLKCLSLYTKTLIQVQSLVPYKLIDGLASLKKSALLADESLRGIEGLRLDIYERWCGDEIQYFTPFVRHDDLEGKQAKEMLTTWAKKGIDMLLQGLEKTLEGITEFKSIVDMRTEVFKLWIAEGSKAKGFDPSIVLDQFRSVIGKHMLRVLETKVNKLRLVGSEVTATLQAWHTGVTEKHRGLWDDGSFDTELSQGAALFVQDVVARLYGRNDAVSKAISCYKSWHRIIDDVGQIVEQLRRQRWDNDVDDIEDEETIEQRQQLLSKDDPKKLNDHLQSALVKAFKGLDDQLAVLWEQYHEDPNKGAIAMYLARLLRDLRSQLPDQEPVKGFGLEIVPSLHATIVYHAASVPLREFSSNALRRKVVGRSLWEGEPNLPTSPSPATFRLLRNLSSAMEDAGGDLWSPAAIAALRQHLSTQLQELWLEALEGLFATIIQDAAEVSERESEGNDEKQGETESGVKSEQEAGHKDPLELSQRQDLLTQWLFDVSYLRCCLDTTKEATEGGLIQVEEVILEKSEMIDAEARKRISKASQEYWKRTSLLFGLLL